jgi:hypothetical protein
LSLIEAIVGCHVTHPCKRRSDYDYRLPPGPPGIEPETVLLDPEDLPVVRAELERTLALTQQRLDELQIAEQALRDHTAPGP